MSTERKLESVFLFVTGRCNAKCAMCFYAQEMDKKQPDLTFEEMKDLADKRMYADKEDYYRRSGKERRKI